MSLCSRSSDVSPDRPILNWHAECTKWVSISLVAGSLALVIFAAMGAFGGVGLFAPQSALPNWLNHAFEVVGTGGCRAAFIVGGAFYTVLCTALAAAYALALETPDSPPPPAKPEKTPEKPKIAPAPTETQIFEAIKLKSSNEAIEVMDNEEFDSNAVDSVGQTLLYCAVKHQKEPVVDRLLDEEELDPNKKNRINGDFPLYAAAQDTTNVSILKKLLKDKRVSLFTQNNFGDTALHAAEKAKNASAITLLKQKAGSLFSRGKAVFGYRYPTLLEEVSEGKETDIRRILDSENGAMIIKNEGSKLLEQAIASGYVGIAKLFIDRGVKINGAHREAAQKSQKPEIIQLIGSIPHDGTD